MSFILVYGMHASPENNTLSPCRVIVSLFNGVSHYFISISPSFCFFLVRCSVHLHSMTKFPTFAFYFFDILLLISFLSPSIIPGAKIIHNALIGLGSIEN